MSRNLKKGLIAFKEFLALEVIHMQFSQSSKVFFKQNYPNGAVLIVISHFNSFAFSFPPLFLFCDLNFISSDL